MTKYILLRLSLWLTSITFAQNAETNDKKVAFYEKIMETEGADFEVTAVPEQWKNARCGFIMIAPLITGAFFKLL